MNYFSFLFILIAFHSIGQEKIVIKDASTKETMPFVKVMPSKGDPLLSDIDGVFVWPEQAQSVSLRYSGYKDTTIQVADVRNNTVLMTARVQQIQEVVVVPGENPAHRIIEQTIANRKKNHPLENDAFTYESYSKFVFDMNQEMLDQMPDSVGIDSIKLKFQDYLKSRHLFLMESASKRTFIPPYNDKEEIIAYKISGISDPMLSTFAQSMQSFSFYDNQFDILEKKYISPIAMGGTRRYLFILEDTTIINADTTYTIFFRPRKGKSFDGLTGHLFINTNGFAVEKVIARPYDEFGISQVDVEIVQEYVYTNDHKWFPSKLSTQIVFKSYISELKESRDMIQGKGSTYLENIQFNPPGLKKRFNDNIALSVAVDAIELKEDEWDSLRVHKITTKEALTYISLDSLSKEWKLQRKFDILKTLSTGRLPLGKLNLVLDRITNYNVYEGARWGAGLETSEKLMKRVLVGGYFGWGSLDKAWKYGGYSKIFLDKDYRFQLNAKFQQDLIERGGMRFENNNFVLNDPTLYRNFFINRMESQRIAEISVGADIKSNIQLKLIGNYQRINYLEEYRYIPIAPISEQDIAEIGVEFHWSIRERYMLLGSQKIPQGSSYPRISLKLLRGIDGIYNSDLSYWRAHTEVRQSFTVRGIGRFDWQASASFATPEMPLFLNHVAPGTGYRWTPIALHSFETIEPGTYYSSAQVALFMRYTFSLIKTKALWNEPMMSLHHAVGYGYLSGKEDHSVSFSTMDKGYYEAGIILKGLLIMGFSSIDIGCFYNYGYYANIDWVENLYPKVSLSFTLQ